MEGSYSELCLQAEPSLQASPDRAAAVGTQHLETATAVPNSRVPISVDQHTPQLLMKPPETIITAGYPATAAAADTQNAGTINPPPEPPFGMGQAAAANAAASELRASVELAGQQSAHATAAAATAAEGGSPAVEVTTTAATAAADSQLGSAMRSSSGGSRRTSRTRVGEAAPVLPCEPAQLQLQQQQHLPQTPGTFPAGPSGPTLPPPPPAVAVAVAAAAASLAVPGGAAPGPEPAQPCGVMTPSYRKATSSTICSLHVHGTSQLVPDLLLTDPVVRLHVVHAATGEYVRMLQQLDQTQQQQQQQRASAGGSSTLEAARGLPLTRHPISNGMHSELLDYPGRPALATLDNNTPCPKAALLEHIHAVQTRPFSMTTSSSSNSAATGDDTGGSNGGSRGGLSAAWDEELSVDMSPQQLVEGDALLLLEVLQLPGGFSRYKRHAGDFGKSGAGHSIAWAFLRLSGLQQSQLLLDQQPLNVKLQLYRYSPGALRPEGLLSPRLAVPHPVTAAKPAYLSFKLSGFLAQSQAAPAATSPVPSPAAAAGNGSLQPAAPSSSSSSPWRVGLWSPWANEGLGSPGLQGKLSSHGLPAAGVQKYPAYVEVTLSAIPRPNGAVVVTDPAAGIRPALPAGYGSGFEIGRMPVSLLYMPRAMRGVRGSAGGVRLSGGSLSGDDAFGPGSMADEATLLLESRLHRPHTHPCQVPNALLAEVKGTAGGCSAISISREGRWLAAACGDDKGCFKVVLYHALTGRLCWVLGSHAGMVHSISWAKDDSAVVTGSADFTAKVWHLPELPGALSNSLQSARIYSMTQFACEQSVRTAGQAAATPASPPRSPTRPYASTLTSSSAVAAEHATLMSASLGATAAAAGVSVTVLQHTCFVYAAEAHPMLQPLPTVVTAGFDGTLRLWNMEGMVLCSLLVSAVPVNCLAFDQLGTRVFVGDAAGVLTELSLDLTQLSAAAAAAAAAGAASTWSPGKSADCDWLSGTAALAAAGSSSGCRELGGGCTAAADSIGGTAAGGACGGNSSSSGVVAAAASTARRAPHGSSITQHLAGVQLLKKLRVSQELAGCSLVSLMSHPGGHHLLVLARSPKGVSDLVAMDAKLLLVARRFTGIRCAIAPIKFALSPDGHYVVCGSEDGSITIWDFATATPTPMPHMAMGGAPIHSMAWSSCFQAVAVCSFSHYAPIRVLGFAADQQQVVLNPPRPGVQQHGRSQVQEAGAVALADVHKPLRCPLPDQLTPAHVHALLSDLRLSASQRGLYSQPSDPHGQQLMVPATGTKQLPRRLGSRPATSAGSLGPACNQTAAACTTGLGTVQQPQTPGVAGLQSGAAACEVSPATQQGAMLLPHALPSQDRVKQHTQQHDCQAQLQKDLIPAGSSQPTTPRVIDGASSAGAAVIAPPWQG